MRARPKAPPEAPFDLLWPPARLPEALTEAIFRADLATGAVARATVAPMPAPERGASGRTRWLRHAARPLGAEGSVETVAALALRAALSRPGPYLVLMPGETGGALALVRGRGARCAVVRPDGGEWHTDTRAVGDALRATTHQPTAVTPLFAGLPGGAAALRRLVAREGIGEASFTVVHYGLDAAHPFAAQLKAVGLFRRVAAYAAVTALQGAAAVLAALTLGDAAVTGRIDLGRVVAWSVLAASNVPLQYAASSLLGRASLDVAAAFKRRLLEGALALRDTELRSQGFGLLIARLNEASVVEQTNIADLFGVLAPAGQLVGAFILLATGALPAVELPLGAAFLAGAVVLGAAYHRRYRRCYAERLGLTEDLVEKIVGHRTRAVQANPDRLHHEEDLALQSYATETTALNASGALSEVYGRLWLLAAGLVLLFAFATNTTGAASLLPTVIGIYLAYLSLPAVLAFLQRLTMWICAWQGVRPLFAAGHTRGRAWRSRLDPEPSAATGLDTVVSSVSFAYREGGRAVLEEASVRIRAGERVLVGGPSGGGKTTLSKLLTGELRAKSGTILVDGLDCFSVSEAEWRRRVASSPQFHENYVFSNTFGFNVDPKGFDGELSPEARSVCFELGLRELLGKMPARAAQILGETGWQLSHGERSRVFIARSLLQGADLLVFDESFGALDPESLALALECVRKRARTLVVIAHQ